MADGVDPLTAGLPLGVVGCFTTRHGGVSDAPWNSLNLALHVEDDPGRVYANRAAVTHHLGSGPVVYAAQVHGADVAVIDNPRPGVGPSGVPGVDALVTDVPGVPLAVLVADCLPVLFADQAHRVVGAAHAGRRGLAGGVLQATVEAMLDLGADLVTMTGVVGPAVCRSCYEVPVEMREEVDTIVPGSASTTRQGTPSLDLAIGAVGILNSLGLARVQQLGICTLEDPRFFSYRGERRTGRFAGVVMLEQS